MIINHKESYWPENTQPSWKYISSVTVTNFPLQRLISIERKDCLSDTINIIVLKGVKSLFVF